MALRGAAGVARCFGLRTMQDRVDSGIHDDRAVRAMARQGHAEAAWISGKRGRFAVAGQRMENDDGFALQALRLVGEEPECCS